MTDKVQKIREEVEKRYEYWKEKESNSHSIESEIRMSECKHLLLMLDSLQKEPVSENLEEEVGNYIKMNGYDGLDSIEEVKYIANYFAKWGENHLWKPADGDELPEIGRDVICLLDCGKVIKAHRPSKKDNLYVPEPYGKGEWNYPNIKYWLDAELPKEIEL